MCILFAIPAPAEGSIHNCYDRISSFLLTVHSNDEAGITDEPHLLLERELSKVLHHQLHSWQSAQSRNNVAFIGEDATGVHWRVVSGQPPDDQKDLQSLVRGNQLGVL